MPLSMAASNDFWCPPKIWQDDTAFILGGGPSLNDVNFDLIKDKHVIGTNNAYLLGEWVDICWFGDCRWYEWHKDKLEEYGGIVATCCVNLAGKQKRCKVLKRGKPVGIAPKHGLIAWNRNTGASAINFAYHLGVRRVVLLGYDMRRINDRKNWHEHHPAQQANPYARFLRCFPAIKTDADKLGLEIINATPESALTLFPIMTLEEVLEQE